MPALPATWPSELSWFLPVPRLPIDFLSRCGCVCLCVGLLLALTLAKPEQECPENSEFPGYPPAHCTQERGCCASQSRAPPPDTHPCTLTPEPASARPGRHLGEEMPATFLSASPGTLRRPSASSEARSVVQAPVHPGRASCGGCDSGLSQARQDVRAIPWATRNLTLLFIGIVTAGPAWWGGSGLRCRRVRGMGAAGPGPGRREASPAPLPAYRVCRPAANWASSPISEQSRLGQAGTMSPEPTQPMN